MKNATVKSQVSGAQAHQVRVERNTELWEEAMANVWGWVPWKKSSMKEVVFRLDIIAQVSFGHYCTTYTRAQSSRRGRLDTLLNCSRHLIVIDSIKLLLHSAWHGGNSSHLCVNVNHSIWRKKIKRPHWQYEGFLR